MADKCVCNDEVPGFMAQLLQELGWNEGTRIPLANAVNQALESELIKRQNEIQRLKEAIITQEEKNADLNNYKQYVQTEYQENTRLLFAHKQQMEQEVKLTQMSQNEAVTLGRETVALAKQTDEVAPRVDRLQREISKLLKKADSMKGEICGEKGTLQEWRAQLDRNSGDITAIEQFKKQDISKAKALETKRQKLKVEHDKMHERLVHLVGNLSAEERACERISFQVKEGMEQRKNMLQMWTEAIENLRQRDTDIRHIREDYAVLEAEAVKVTEQCREQQAFCDQQRGNNADAERENAALAQRLANTRIAYQRTAHDNATLDNEAKTLQREMQNMQVMLEKMHMENKRIMEEQHKKDIAIKAVINKIKELKAKVLESQDKTKSSEKRAKELEDILNEEEKYASQLTQSQQRGMHCAFVEQQKLLALKNEDKIFTMQIKAAKATMTKLDSKQKVAEKNLQAQKETIYGIMYRTEINGARAAMLEGASSEPANEAELNACEARLKDVLARHSARLALLERHSAKLHDDMRRLARDLEHANATHSKLKGRLKSSMLTVEGGEKEAKESRAHWRRMRVEEALMKLRVAHARRALGGLDHAGYTLEQQRLRLDAALKERLVEIEARREMFALNRRALYEDCGRLVRQLRERESRIEQLKKRYEIFLSSLGKDESGQTLAPSFFKIKFAEERANLREKGAALDAEIGRCERQISALEATRAVMQAAHKHFMRKITPLAEDTPEIQELRSLTSQYYELRDALKGQLATQAELERRVEELAERHGQLADRTTALAAREADAENDVECTRERISTQQGRLENARGHVRHCLKRARILMDNVDEWRTFQMALWIRDYADAAYNALRQLCELCDGAPHASSRLAALVSATDIEHLLTAPQRRLKTFIQRIVSGAERTASVDYLTDGAESVFTTSSESTHSGLSMASGYTRRITGFRKTLASKIAEPALTDAIQESSEDNATLHAFPNPVKDAERFQAWIDAIGNNLSTLDPQYVYKNRRVCHAHFETKYLTWSKRLCFGAVPTLLLPGFHNERAPLMDITNRVEHAIPTLNAAVPSTSTDVTAASTKDKEEKGTARRPMNIKRKPQKLSFDNNRALQEQITKLTNKKDSYATRLKKALHLADNKTFQNAINKFTTLAALFTLMQFREISKKKMGRRFTEPEKIMALSLYKRSPRTYRWLQKIFILPSPPTLSRLISKPNLKPGINDNVFKLLKNRADKMKADEKLCMLLFDEMSIAPHFDYNRRKDMISGFVSNGKSRTKKIADHALVFMIRGIQKNYKQPVAYTFCTGSTKKEELAVMIKEIIKKLHEAGLRVLATVCDQGASNVAAINYLIQETRTKYIKKNQELRADIFEIDNEEVIPLYDPPHLIKGIRNNLLTKDLKCSINGSTKLAKWDHIVKLQQEDPAYKGIRLIKKLTDQHINPDKFQKMKVKFATQVLSERVATTMGFLAAMRSTVSLRVVTLGLGQSVSNVNGNLPVNSPGTRKSFR